MHSSNQYEVFIVKVIGFMPELQACFYINLWYEPKQCLFPSIYVACRHSTNFLICKLKVTWHVCGQYCLEYIHCIHMYITKLSV